MVEEFRQFNARSSYSVSGSLSGGHDPPTRTPPLNFIFEVLEPDTVTSYSSYDIRLKKSLYQIDRLVLRPLKPDPGDEPPPSYPRATILPKSIRLDTADKHSTRAAAARIMIDGVEYEEVASAGLPADSKKTCDYPRVIELGGKIYRLVTRRGPRELPVVIMKEGALHVLESWKGIVKIDAERLFEEQRRREASGGQEETGQKYVPLERREDTPPPLDRRGETKP